MTITKQESARRAGIFAVKKAHELKRQRVEEYEKDPLLCVQCRKPLSYAAKISGNKFCNKSCSASHNNLGVRHNPKTRTEKECLVCEKMTISKFCSLDCSARYQRQIVFDSIENGTYTTGSKGAIKKYLLEKRGRKCEVCGLTEWMGNPIPLDSHHKDGNYQNNIPSNLQLLCLNCHGIITEGRTKETVDFQECSAITVEKVINGA